MSGYDNYRKIEYALYEGEWSKFKGEVLKNELDMPSDKFNILYSIGNIFQPNRNYENTNILNKLGSAFNDILINIYYVPATRGFQKPSYTQQETSTLDFVTSNLDVQNQQLLTTLGINRKYENKISKIVKKITNVEIMVHLFNQKQIGITLNKDKLEDISIVNEGYGTNQIIQLITSLIIAPKNSTILIEEPEIHLHPKAQIDLIENIIKISQEENKQIIMTTHSENILFKILSLIKINELSLDDLSIVHFKYENNATVVEELQINQSGQVKGGLKSFYNVQIKQFSEMIPKKYLNEK